MSAHADDMGSANLSFGTLQRRGRRVAAAEHRSGFIVKITGYCALLVLVVGGYVATLGGLAYVLARLILR